MDTRKQLRDFIIDNFMLGKDDESLTDSGSLLDLGIIDSTGVLELVGFLEETFGIGVADDDLVPENLDSVDNLVKYVERKKSA